MLMMQGLWAVNVIKGIIQTPDRQECVEDIERRYAENANLTDILKMINSQADYIKQLSGDLNYTEILHCDVEVCVTLS